VWKHQEAAIEKAKNLSNIMLNHDVGTGKTLSAINILRWKCAINHRLLRTLIICPIVVLDNWRKNIPELSKIDKRDVVVLKGSGKKKAAQIEKMTENYTREKILITNIESLQNEDVYQNLLKYSAEMLILDESHMCKNYKSKRAKILVNIADRAKYRALLTGTPILNSIEDIFMQYRILDGGQTFGKNFFVFRARYMYDTNAAWSSRPGYFPNYQPRPEMFDELSEKMYTKMHRAIKSECLDLPPYLVQTRSIALSKEQRKIYDEMKRDFITFIETSKEPKAVVATLAITKALRMLQIVTGFVKTEDGEEIVIKKNPRLEELKNLLEMITPENKVIVWCIFKQNYKDISKLCETLKIPYVMLNGSMSAEEKKIAIDQFQGDPTIKIMVANQQAGGTGVNLQQASYSIYYSRNFSLAHDLQSEARCYRGGSEIHEKITRINLVAEDTIDQLVSEALERKENLSKKILDKNIISKL